MSPDPFQPHPISPRGGKPCRDTGVGSPGYLAGPPPLQVPSNTAHKISPSRSIQLRDPHDPQHQCTDRITMVETECSNYKWESNQPPCPRLVHNVRRVQLGLGCMQQGLNRKRSLVSLGSRKPHKHSGTKSCLSCHQSLSQRPVQHLCLPLHGQHNLHKKQRGNPSPQLVSLTLDL